MIAVREPAVAGLFYPGDSRGLRATVDALLEAAAPGQGPAPKVLIVPHAGYVYSGPVAAAGYARLAAHRHRYRRVVLLGPCHRVPVRGLAASGADAFDTPLGRVPVDKAAVASLEGLGVRVVEAPHRHEHSLEVHLPFLQRVIGDFVLVPLVVGDAQPEEVARVLDTLWDGEETLIVVSSDLSHYHPYERARAMDRQTSAAIERLDAGAVDHAHACGATPLAGLLTIAKTRGLKVETVDLRTSGDTSGDRDSVVGYGAWVLVE